MSRNTKCPVCKTGTIMFKDNWDRECSQCSFNCTDEDLYKILAGTLKPETPGLQVNVRYLDPDMPKLSMLDVGNWCDVRVAGVRGTEWISQAEGGTWHAYQQGDFMLFELGFAMQIPTGYEAYLVPRSSLFKNTRCIQTNGLGIIDNSYRGDNDQWLMPVYATDEGIIFQYDRVGQFRLMPVMGRLVFNEFESFPDSVDRGGFGSTGVR